MSKDATDLKDLNASSLAIGTVSPDRLGTGTVSTATFLRGDSTWVVPTAPVAGADTQVQYNAAGVIGASPSFTFDYITGTLTATNLIGSGDGITNLNASNVTLGTVPTARLGSGSPSAGAFLRGDSSWQATQNTPPGGPNLAVQINSGGVFGGDGNFTFNTASTPPLIALNGTLDCIATSGHSLQYRDVTTVVKGGITAYGNAFGTLATPCACGRLTFDPKHAASNNSYTGASTAILYYLPVNGNQITLWNSYLGDFENIVIPDAGWNLNLLNAGVVSYALYDIFIQNNLNGTAALVLGSVWTTNNARSTTLTSPINGMLFSSGNRVLRYVGTMMSQAAGQGADTPGLRLLWNAHNQVPRKLFFSYGAPGTQWQYLIPGDGVSRSRAAGNDPTARLHWVVGVVGTSMGTAGVPWISVDSAQLFNTTPVLNLAALGGVALDNANPVGMVNEIQSQCNTSNIAMLWNRFCPTTQITTPGWHWLTLMEGAYNPSGTTSGPYFYGGPACCISGFIWC